MYFFKGSDYWKFDPTRKPPVRLLFDILHVLYMLADNARYAGLSYTRGV